MGNKLCRAAKKGDLSTVQFLLDRGVNVNAKSVLGNTALHCAVQYGRLNIASRLLDKGADFSAMGQIGTALCIAILFNDIPAVTLLLKKGVDINSVLDKEGVSALHVALSKRFVKDVRGQYEHLDERKKLPMIEFLLDNGADVNPASNGSTATTPLMMAAALNYTDVVQLLIKRGANTDLVNKHRKRAFDYAKRGPAKAMLQKLTANRVDVEAASRVHEQSMSDALTPILYGRYLVALNLYYQDLKNYMNERDYETAGQHTIQTAKPIPKSSELSGDSIESKAVCDSTKGSDSGTSIGTIPGPHTPYEPPHELRERIANILIALTARHDEMTKKGNILSCSVCRACIAEIETISPAPILAMSA